MADMNAVIGRNILSVMKEQNKKQTDLAKELNYSKQTVSKMLNGSREISAVELNQISKYLGVRMSELTKVSNNGQESMRCVFMGCMRPTGEEKITEQLEELTNLAIFQRRIRNHLESARERVK